ncbi:MAG: DUF4886 domain-containing protein [Oscillospiraceae bacterium]|nr:DUF4886 domain-containing protein [Oscillospiraceae bacterium]
MKTLKKLISLLLCPLLLLPFCGSAAKPAETAPADTEPTMKVDPKTPVSDGKTLKILCVTSSFGLNTTELLYDIAKDQGAEDVIIARLYYSGCKLAQHVEFAKTNAPEYEYTKNSDGQWVKLKQITLLYGLQDEDWDIIFMQQGAHHAGMVQTYKDYIDQLMVYLNANKTNPDARFIWNMTWAFQHDNDSATFMEQYKGDQMTMYNMILDTTKEKVVPRTDFAAIIPSGTAVQNARTSYFGDTLTKDTLHLNNLGRIIAGYTTWCTLTGKTLEEINLPPVNSYDLKEPVILTDADKAVIIEAVNNAMANPWEVTPSSYPEKPQ